MGQVILKGYFIIIVVSLCILCSCASIDAEMYYDYPIETDKEAIA